MTLADLKQRLTSSDVGRAMYQLVVELFPICRSITGNGLRETLRIMQEHIPLQIHEVPTGTKVFDWTVPKEWNIRDAYVKNSKGERVIDFNKSNLHVVNYSVPVKARLSLAELAEHLFTLQEHPDWIPYRTSYYKEQWGFCLSHNQLLGLKDDLYEICIDSALEDGSLSYGEYYVQGQSTDEVLISCHVCHPSLGNDNLSGVAVATFLAKHLSALPLHYSYRFLFIPGTIGSITWLCLNETHVFKIKHGLVLAGVGDAGQYTYKRSRRGNAMIDKAVEYVLKYSSQDYAIVDFSPYGYDERQYCSPGFNLPVGTLMKTPHGEYPEYHTSADNLDFVHAEALQATFLKCLAVFNILENDRRYLSQNLKCEPQLGNRGLYGSIGGQADGRLSQLARLWVLNLSDGQHSLFEVTERAGLEFDLVRVAADELLAHDLLKECPATSKLSA